MRVPPPHVVVVVAKAYNNDLVLKEESCCYYDADGVPRRRPSSECQLILSAEESARLCEHGAVVAHQKRRRSRYWYARARGAVKGVGVFLAKVGGEALA